MWAGVVGPVFLCVLSGVVRRTDKNGFQNIFPLEIHFEKNSELTGKWHGCIISLWKSDAICGTLTVPDIPHGVPAKLEILWGEEERTQRLSPTGGRAR